MIRDYSRYEDKELLDLMSSPNKRIREESFLEIYNRTNRIIYTYISKIINNSEEASDIFQDVYLKFVDMISKKNEIFNIKYILITISRNACFNYIKKKKEIFVEDLSELIIDDSIKEENDAMKILNRGLDMLDDASKDLILLKYYDGFSYEELEEITGLTTAILKNRIWRGKEKLKKILKPYIQVIKSEIEN